MRSFFILLALSLAACFSQVFGEPLEPVASVEFLGDVKAPEDISAIGKLGALLMIGADEAVGEDENQNIIQFMEQVGDNSYKVSKDLLLFEGNEEDGKDMIPGEDRDPKDVGKLILLGEIEPPMSVDPPARAKAEGIVNLIQQGSEYDLIVVYDSGAKGAAQRFRVTKP